MANIRAIDILILDDVFDMSSGYVLDFSDRTMSQFFAQELNVDIDAPLYKEHGTSKAKRLRCFLQKVDAATAVRTLNALWEYREASRLRRGKEDAVQNAHGQLLSLINRVEGKSEATRPMGQPPAPAFDRFKVLALKNELIGLGQLSPQQRGYAFEKILRDLFNAFGLEAREPFRLKGEQIDGSFCSARRSLSRGSKVAGCPYRGCRSAQFPRQA